MNKIEKDLETIKNMLAQLLRPTHGSFRYMTNEDIIKEYEPASEPIKEVDYNHWVCRNCNSTNVKEDKKCCMCDYAHNYSKTV